MKYARFMLVLVLVSVSATGCWWRKKTDFRKYQTKLPPGMSALDRSLAASITINLKEAWAGDRSGLAESIRNSLGYLAKPSSRKYFPYDDITHDDAVKSLQRFLELLLETSSAGEFDTKVREEFDFYVSRGWNGKGGVLFTGYYTPIFNASRVPTAKFRYPLYGLPNDLVKDDQGATLGRKTPGGDMVRYYTRSEIERFGALKNRGLEIAWLADRFENYVVTIQGSARLRLPDGSMMGIGYAGNNGHEYHSVMLDLAEEGKIRSHELSLNKAIEYFGKHPGEMDEYLYRNDRYVFFTEGSGAPVGSINVPVTPYRSIATDKSIFPRACLALVSTRVPVMDGGGRVKMEDRSFFTLDQDTGGAIRAAGRCDIYVGTGDEAGELAGRQLSEGTLCYLFLKK